VLPVDFATGTKSNTAAPPAAVATPATAAAAARLHAGGRPVTSRRVAGRRVASPLFTTAAALRCSLGLHCVCASTAGALPRRPASVMTLLRDCCGRKGRRLSSVLPANRDENNTAAPPAALATPAAAAAAAARRHAGGRPVASRRVASRLVTSRRVASPLFATAAAQHLGLRCVGASTSGALARRHASVRTRCSCTLASRTGEGAFVLPAGFATGTKSNSRAAPAATAAAAAAAAR
jgi:hypothetical protein